MVNTTSGTETINAFWNWFSQHQLTFRSIIDGEYDYIDSILNELRKIQKGLAVEFERSTDKIAMTISADGVAENFDIVQQIVQESPEINSWEFIAFRQPVAKEKIDDLTITVSGVSLDPKHLMFLPIVEDELLYIQIFYDALTEENENMISYGCLMLLDNIIGEFDCVTKVAGYEFYNLSEATDFIEELRPLTQMRDFLDEYYGN